MERGSTLEVVFCGCLVIRPIVNQLVSSIFCKCPPGVLLVVNRDVHLLAAKDKTLLDRRDAFLLFDAFLYPGDLVLPFVSVKAFF